MLLSIILFSNTSFACRPAKSTLEALNRLEATTMRSEDGRYLLKMIPSRWAKHKSWFIKTRESYGVAFKVRKDGRLRYLWSGKGLHPTEMRNGSSSFPDRFSIFFSRNGKTVIKVKKKPYQDDKDAVVVFNKGKVIKRYPLAYFGTGFRKNTCNKIRWLANYKKIAFVSNKLHFQTADGKNWHIDAHSGKISQN